MVDGVVWASKKKILNIWYGCNPDIISKNAIFLCVLNSFFFRYSWHGYMMSSFVPPFCIVVVVVAVFRVAARKNLGRVSGDMTVYLCICIGVFVYFVSCIVHCVRIVVVWQFLGLRARKKVGRVSGDMTVT